MKKKYMIRCDMEGASGVVSLNQIEPGKDGYETGLKYFMADLLAVINGLNDGGADEIHIYDEHFFGTNVDLSVLPDNVIVYCGKPKYTAEWGGGLDSSFSGLALVGLHSKYGTENALLNHTYEDDIIDIVINDISVGEIGLESAIAGEFDVPLVFLTADSEGVKEALEIVPDTFYVSVKESLGVNSAICFPLGFMTKKIRDTAKLAAKKSSEIQPFKIGSPVKLTVTLKDGLFCKNMREKFSAVDDKNRVVIERDTLLEAYSSYWTMKLECL